MMKKSKVCVISSSRADFGLLAPLVEELLSKSSLETIFIATGSHLSKEHGYTLSDIEERGVHVDFKVDIGMDNKSATAIGETLSRAVNSFSSLLNNISPQLIIILGDRYEMLGVATAAMCLDIPIAHLHGGELTEGAQDDAIRHAITKLSTLHFVCSETYRRRVIQLGEHPSKVFNTGSLGIDNITNISRLDKTALESQLKIELSQNNILISYHSTTLVKDDLKHLKFMLDDLSRLENTSIIVTMPNADMGGKQIEAMLRKFCLSSQKYYFFDNLGTQKYISFLEHCDFIIGNSSSGILEAPFVGCYTINLGARQKGRLQASTVFNVEPRPGEIYEKINELLPSLESHGKPVSNSIFGDGNARRKIASIVEDQIGNIQTRKAFFDVV